MLLELKVSHFAVIDSLEVHFLRPGLNVLTGETGAGKSILLKSLSLLLGGKASPDVIRAGHEQAIIEGAFDLSYRPDVREALKELALDSGEDTLVIRRLINVGGKHRLYINGSLSTLNILEKIVPSLVEITGQHEHHSLTRPAAQMDLLDEFAGLSESREEFGALFHRAQELREGIENLSSAARDREQRLDFLRYQVQEIQAFNPVAGEDADLNAKFQRAKYSTKLHGFAQRSESVLYSDDHSVNAVLAELLQEGDSLAGLDARLKPVMAALKEAQVVLEDASFSLRDYRKNESVDPAELDKIEDRVSGLKKLQKKYGATAEEILEFKNKTEKEIQNLEGHDENVKQMRVQLSNVEKEMKDRATELHAKRIKSAKKLAEGINLEIQELNMKGTEFSITVAETESIQLTGTDEVTFLIRSSPKDSFRPVGKIASGGELSRLMLAIKQVISRQVVSSHGQDAGAGAHMTFLFDEVDTGVSGPTAEKVGKKLKALGSFHQVICITHLPQVAAFADAHFLITKEVTGGLVKSRVLELGDKERVQELARMISGEKVTTASLKHAREMVDAHKPTHKVSHKASHKLSKKAEKNQLAEKPGRKPHVHA